MECNSSIVGRLVSHQTVRNEGFGVVSRYIGKMIIETVLSTPRSGRTTVDVETAGTERSVAIEETFRKMSGSPWLMGVIIIAITSGDVVVIVIANIKMSTALGVSIVADNGTLRGRGGIGDGGRGSREGIINFTVGSQAVPIARGHASAR